jgi:hypothetical protein
VVGYGIHVGGPENGADRSKGMYSFPEENYVHVGATSDVPNASLYENSAAANWWAKVPLVNATSALHDTWTRELPAGDGRADFSKLTVAPAIAITQIGALPSDSAAWAARAQRNRSAAQRD